MFDFHVYDSEMAEIKEAFNKFKDEDQCISIQQLFKSLRDKKHDTIYSAVFHEILERISGFPEMHNDPRVDFEQFKKLLIKAMRMRRSKQEVDLLFNIVDTNSDSRIRAYDLCRVSGLVN